MSQRRPPPRAPRVRESEHDKYKQHWITSCLYLTCSESLLAGHGPAAADAYSPFDSSFLRRIAVGSFQFDSEVRSLSGLM